MGAVKDVQLELFELAPRNEGRARVDWSKGGISSLRLQRFKRFRSFDVDFDRVTLLVGTNSSGKTSILQAIRFFFWCIAACLRRSDSGYGFAKAVIPYSDFHLIPAHDLRELCFQGLSPNRKALGIVLKGTLKNGLTLTFRIYASYSTLMVVNPEDQPKEPLSGDQFSYINRSPLYIPGFFGVVTRELLAHDARLEQLLNSGHHNEVLRNIILRLKGNPAGLERLLTIMKDEFQTSSINLPFSQKTTEFLKAEYVEPNLRIPLDFVSAGSGFLQVLQIMAHALQNPSPIVLLDEPDAHMHHDLQRSFLRFLRAFADSEDLQIVMASHSETFVRETPLDEIRVIDSDWDRAGKFPSAPDLQEELSKAGIWPTRLELAEILRTRRVLLVEGEPDQAVLNRLGRLTHDDWDAGIRLIQVVPSDGSDDATARRLEYVQKVLSRILVGGLRIAHLRDRDLLCDAAVEAITKEASTKNLALHILSVRNREALLVRPYLVERAVQKRYGDSLPPELRRKGAVGALVKGEIQRWCKSELDEIPVKVQEYNRAWIRKTFEHEEVRKGEKLVTTFIRTSWQEPITQDQIPWKLLDGKAVLRQVRRSLQDHAVSLSDDAILDVMTTDDFDDSLKATVELLHSWFTE